MGNLVSCRFGKTASSAMLYFHPFLILFNVALLSLLPLFFLGRRQPVSRTSILTEVQISRDQRVLQRKKEHSALSIQSSVRGYVTACMSDM